MLFEEKQYIVSKMLFCQSYFEWRGRQFYIDRFNLQDRFISESIYQDTINKCDDCLSSDELIYWMHQNQFWDNSKENALRGFKDDIEKLKLQMLDSRFQQTSREKFRAMLRIAEKNADALENEKLQFKYVTQEGIAAHAKLQYLIGSSIKLMNGKKFLNDGFWYNRMHPIISFGLQKYLENRIEEDSIREIARTEPWISIWNGASISKHSLFNCHAGELTDEEKFLIMWTRIYENARSAEGMGDDIINDDDLFDGWLIRQNKEKKVAEDKVWIESKITNPKVANSEHIFIMAETAEDIRRIHDANDVGAKIAKKNLFNEISSREITKDQDTSLAREKMRAMLLAKQNG